MTTLLNPFEQPASGTITTSNTGGTDADLLDEAIIGANMTMATDSTSPMHGTTAAKLALTSTATAITYTGWSASVFTAAFGGALARMFGAFYFRTNAATVASSIRLIQFRQAGVLLGSIGRSNGTNGFHFRDAADAQAGGISAAVSANTWYRVEFDVICGGTSNLFVYVGDSLTQQGTAASFVGTIGGTGIDEGRLGFNTTNFSSTSGDFILLDSLNFNNVGVPGPGPYTKGPVWPPAEPNAPTLRLAQSILRSR